MQYIYVYYVCLNVGYRLSLHDGRLYDCDINYWDTCFMSEVSDCRFEGVKVHNPDQERILRWSILTFVWPCIVIYFYSKTNQMRNISNLFYFGTTLYMFRTVPSSIIWSPRLYIQHQVYVIRVLWLLASKQPQNPNSRWWTKRPSETCRVLFPNKINLIYRASGWFYYRNILRYVLNYAIASKQPQNLYDIYLMLYVHS